MNTIDVFDSRARPHRVVISVGSNLGDKLANCRRGVEALLESSGAKLSGRSRFYRTSPVDYTAQDWFVNAAVLLETSLAPLALLRVIQEVEKRFGRRRSDIRFGPRTLDMDIIFFDDRVVRSEQLTVPHPRMHKRRFVLAPICDIDPKIVHPLLQQDVQSLLRGLDDETQSIVEIQ